VPDIRNTLLQLCIKSSPMPILFFSFVFDTALQPDSAVLSSSSFVPRWRSNHFHMANKIDASFFPLFFSNLNLFFGPLFVGVLPFSFPKSRPLTSNVFCLPFFSFLKLRPFRDRLVQCCFFFLIPDALSVVGQHLETICIPFSPPERVDEKGHQRFVLFLSDSRTLLLP